MAATDDAFEPLHGRLTSLTITADAPVSEWLADPLAPDMDLTRFTRLETLCLRNVRYPSLPAWARCFCAITEEPVDTDFEDDGDDDQ